VSHHNIHPPTSNFNFNSNSTHRLSLEEDSSLLYGANIKGADWWYICKESLPDRDRKDAIYRHSILEKRRHNARLSETSISNTSPVLATDYDEDKIWKTWGGPNSNNGNGNGSGSGSGSGSGNGTASKMMPPPPNFKNNNVNFVYRERISVEDANKIHTPDLPPDPVMKKILADLIRRAKSGSNIDNVDEEKIVATVSVVDKSKTKTKRK